MSFSPSLVVAVTLRPKSLPLSSCFAGLCSTSQATGRHKYQSPTGSWLKHPHFQVTPSKRSFSNTRKDLPEKRSDLPLRLSCTALKGSQPNALLEPKLLRYRNRVFLNCLRRV